MQGKCMHCKIDQIDGGRMTDGRNAGSLAQVTVCGCESVGEEGKKPCFSCQA